jgi:adenine-specific DNA-methyltransferase
MDELVKISKMLLKQDDGSIYCSIDDNEFTNCELIFEKYYNKRNLLGNLIWSHGRTSSSHYTQAHEYIISFASNKDLKPLFSFNGNAIISDRAIKKPGTKNPASEIRFPKGMDFESENKVFPIHFGKEEPIEVIEGVFEAKDGKLANEIILKAGWTMKDMIEKWIKGEEVIDSKGQVVNRFFFKNNGVLQYEKIKGTVHPRTIIEGKTTKQGSKILRSLFNSDPFEFPKPPDLIEEIINLNSSNKKEYILDFFAGSGTTFHATQQFNKNGNTTKCILIEMGDYFNSIIIPRIKKIAYTFDWKDGKPKNGSMNGLGVFFKYQRLEQYEESLENIAFTAPGEATQMALKVDSYLPKYFLDFETRESQALVNTTAMQDPWNYTLKVWDGFTYDTEQVVDLVETFNYLIGLHMQKCFTKQINGKKYQFIHGYNNANKKIVVVWRNVKDWTLDDYRADGEALNAELKEVARDLLYINDQANVDNYQPIEEVFKNKMLP